MATPPHEADALLSGVSLAGFVDHKTPPSGAVPGLDPPLMGAPSQAPLSAAPHPLPSSISTLMTSEDARHAHYQQSDQRSIVHIGDAGMGYGGGGGGGEVVSDDIATPNVDPNSVLVLSPTFEEGSGAARPHEFSAEERCCCCRCALSRFLSHCWFCVACLSFVLLSSLPRLLTVADGLVTLLLYLSSGVRDSYPATGDVSVSPQPIDRSVGEFLKYDLQYFTFETSLFDVVLIALIRMVILFFVYAYRFHTHPYTLKTAFGVMICSIIYVSTKLATNTHNESRLVLWYSFGVIIGEYLLFILIRRRRIRAPEDGNRYGFNPSPATSLISDRGHMRGETPSSLLSAAQRYTRLDGDDDSASKLGAAFDSARVALPVNDYAALPPPQPQSAVVHRIQVATAMPTAGAAPSAAAAAGARPAPLHAVAEGTDPSALADPDSQFMVLDGLRVHYKLFRYIPPPAEAAGAAAATAASDSAAAAAPVTPSVDRRRSLSSPAHDLPQDGSVNTDAAAAAAAFSASAATASKDDSSLRANLTTSAGRYGTSSTTPHRQAPGSGGGNKKGRAKQLNPQQRTSSGGSGDGADGNSTAAPSRIDVPIVLLHGFGGSTFSWRRVWRTLCANANCVLAFDRPGFGLTSRPLSTEGRKWTDPLPSTSAAAATAAVDPTPAAVTSALLSGPLFSELLTAPTCSLNPYSAEYSVWLLFRLMTELKLSNAILIGHSTGGALALRAAAVSAAAASAASNGSDAKASAALAASLERVRAVCVVSPTVYSGGFPDLVRSMFRTSLGKGIVQQLVRSELGEAAIRRAWHDQSRVPEDVMASYKRLGKVLHWHEALVEMASVDDRKSARLSKLLAHVKAPVCILHGEDDRLVACSESAKTVTKLNATTADLVVWPGGGHVPHEEFPDTFLVQLFTFLRRWEPYGYSTAAMATAAANAANAAAASASKFNTL